MKIFFASFLMLFVLSAFAKEDAGPKNYVLIYNADSGHCGNFVWPEGGCPHTYEIGYQFFVTKEQALDWMNDHTFKPSGYQVPVITPQEVIGLFKIESKINVNFADSGKTEETYENKAVKVNKPIMIWKAQ